MKTTKRILALITAFILCLAPMALMVGAAETIDVCSVCRHDSGTVISTGLEYREYVGSHNVCFNVYCDDVTWNNEILPLLEKLDSASPDTATWIPIEAIEGDLTITSEERISIMQELYPETFSGVQFKYIYSTKVNKVITYAYVTSDKATRMIGCLETLNA